MDWVKVAMGKLLKRGSKGGVSSWEEYKGLVEVAPTAILVPSSSLKIFNLPEPGEKCVRIGEYSHIFGHFGLVRAEAKLEIGRRCQIGSSDFNCAKSIRVGDDVLMAWGVTVIDNDSHALEWRWRKNDAMQCYRDYRKDTENLIKNKDWSKVAMAPVEIKDKAWIGFNVIILKGVTIGEGAIVAAGSVVTRSVPDYVVVAGNPARVVKRLGGRGL